MLRNRYVLWGGILVLLLIANIIRYIILDWGLITVKVTDAPIGQVIKSIEWQGWVTIYSNIDPSTKVSMYVDKVPLAEAMETLAANAGGQWKLAFFVGPNSSEVKKEIHAFQTDATDDDTKTYSYATMLQMVATDSDMPASDPRLQNWPGVKAPDPAAPAPDAAANGGQAPAPADGSAAPDAPPPPAAPTTAQDFLQSFAQLADIWIMAPGSWGGNTAAAPAPDSSIIHAVEHFVNSNHGSVQEALILRSRSRGGRPDGRRGGGGGEMAMDTMIDRVRNAINGLPEDARPDALSQLNEEVKFQKDVAAAPPEQRRDMFRQHMMAKMANANNSRLSPAKRAQRYARLIAARSAGRGR